MLFTLFNLLIFFSSFFLFFLALSLIHGKFMRRKVIEDFFEERFGNCFWNFMRHGRESMDWGTKSISIGSSTVTG